MNLKYSFTHTLIQSSLTAILLIVWQFYVLEDVFEAMRSQIILVFFIGLFGLGFGILFVKLDPLVRTIITSVMTALMVTLVLVMYPQFGYNFEWHILFIILMLSGVLAHALLYSCGARYGVREDDE
ncbi:MAG: hypothetical protein KAU10_03190 [Dehalococcoidia bacterium]|nr:hypothetical protein [Dehalococcoidia bacterium]